MKRMNYIFIGIYLFVTLYIAIFNWGIFSVSLALNLGLTTIKIPVIACIFLLGLFFLLIQALGASLAIAGANKQRLRMETELNTLRTVLPDANLSDKISVQENLSLLNEKMDMLINHFDVKATGK